MIEIPLLVITLCEISILINVLFALIDFAKLAASISLSLIFDNVNSSSVLFMLRQSAISSISR